MTAIASTQVVVLSDRQVDVVIRALRDRAQTDDLDSVTAGNLADQLQFGAEYVDAIDERIQLDTRKKALAAAVKANDARIKDVVELIDEQWSETGDTAVKRDGITVHRNRGRVFARVLRAGADIQPEERQRACDALKTDPVTADFVREDFSGASLGAHFKELADAYDREQRELPAELRQPRAINDFLPPSCAGVVELSDNPTISVTRS